MSIGASVSVSKALSGFSAPATGGASIDQHQVLDADAVGAGLVVAGLVRQDHAALERHGAELGDARRALVHRQIAADAVAGAVIEIEPGLPEKLPRERIELGAGGAVRETPRAAMAMWPLSTRVKWSRISALGVPTATVRVMSVVPSSYCAPESMQKQFARRDPAVGCAG